MTQQIIERAVCRKFHVPETLVISRFPQETLTMPRNIIWYLLHDSGFTYYRIAKIYGIAESSVRKQVNNVSDWTIKEEMRLIIEELKQEISQ